MIGVGAQILGFVRIGDGTVIALGAVVPRDVPAAARLIGNPVMPVRDWVRRRRLLRD